MEREEEIFVDAVEEVTPRRSNRKRRSTAGSSLSTSSKKSRSVAGKAMNAAQDLLLASRERERTQQGAG